jgi:hypothetical protein
MTVRSVVTKELGEEVQNVVFGEENPELTEDSHHQGRQISSPDIFFCSVAEPVIFWSCVNNNLT